MTSKERYFWDLNGHLIFRNALTKEQVQAANDALDYLARLAPPTPSGRGDGGGGCGGAAGCGGADRAGAPKHIWLWLTGKRSTGTAQIL